MHARFPAGYRRAVGPSRLLGLGRNAHGFSLLELVLTIIILGVITAVAVPKYIELDKTARIAAVTSMAATLTSTSENLHVLCLTASPIACDYNGAGYYLTIAGRPALMHFGYIAAGETLNVNEIDAWVDYAGFTAVERYLLVTYFQLDGSPDPTSCYAAYINPFGNPQHIGDDHHRYHGMLKLSLQMLGSPHKGITRSAIQRC